MSGDTSVSASWPRRGFWLLVVVWVLGVAFAAPRHVARRAQETARGQARLAESAPAPAATSDDSPNGSAAPLAVGLLVASWATLGVLAFWWRRVESSGPERDGSAAADAAARPDEAAGD